MQKKLRSIKKLINSPYFGRLDFKSSLDDKEYTFYIGLHAFLSNKNEPLIYDWRAPISSLFYDYEIGTAHYIAPMGQVEGEILVKRQYKIKKGNMEYMIESSMNINDEVLQRELSNTSDEKMKNIVATLQREQNSIIRNENSKILIIQGVAGSGKTSIALHRVAYLLYRNNGNLKSKDILIISPNKVFGDYISNVLPEFGEEEISEIGMEEVAGNLISKPFQTFNQQVSRLITLTNEEYINCIQYKSTFDFVKDLDEYFLNAEYQYFNPKDIEINGISFTKELVMNKYIDLRNLPIKKRLDKIAQDIISKYKREKNTTLKAYEVKRIRKTVDEMFLYKDTFTLYQNYYTHLNKKELFQIGDNGELEYSDVFPFIYTKLFYEGLNVNNNVKHLLIDEMQDYTPIQYAVISKLYQCRMTILGDGNQSVNPYSSSFIETINKVFETAECVELNKSYRSTYEITTFAQCIRENNKLIPIERHGDKPSISHCQSKIDQISKINHIINHFQHSEYNTLGIICKTQDQADELYHNLKTFQNSIQFLDFHSNEFHGGIIITSAHMAKGLEFDQIIVPNVDYITYNTILDKSLLYIACTRAMHKLDLLYYGEKTPFLNEME
ncbi:MAG: uvrD [Anaerocolumna sp.]|nr:uvrD [Anaerocolumna sp.]